MLTFDHLAVSAATLAGGADHVEAALGVDLAPGGEHPHMGTHNRLLSLGPEEYLEVIAINPDAPTPDHPRWFDLDNFKGAPRVTNWILRSDDLESDLAAAPAGIGQPVALTRGDYAWTMAVPGDGRLPFDGAHPALIAWAGAAHPAKALPDRGIRLTRLEVCHPDADALAHALKDFEDPRIHFAVGAEKAIRATFSTPSGPKVLQ